MGVLKFYQILIVVVCIGRIGNIRGVGGLSINLPKYDLLLRTLVIGVLLLIQLVLNKYVYNIVIVVGVKF